MKLNRYNIFIPLFLILELSSCSFQETSKYKMDFLKRKEEKIDHSLLNKDRKTLNQSKYFPIDISNLKYGNIVYFDLNKYNIRPEFFTILEKHTILLKNYPYKNLLIEGHTDERGTPEYNITLGEKRANSLKEYFKSQGIKSDRIKIFSYGEEKPALSGHSESVYSKNRRAVIIYLDE